MIEAIEATVDASGTVRLARPFRPVQPRRAIVTILDEPPAQAADGLLLSEPALAVDWLSSEEDAAWQHLQ